MTKGIQQYTHGLLCKLNKAQFNFVSVALLPVDVMPLSRFTERYKL